jgi:hypothetical protein
MINLEREPDRVKKKITDTVSVIQKISVKSLRSVQRTCSLQKLPEEIDDSGPAAEAPKKKPVIA